MHDVSVNDAIFDERLFDFRGGDSGVFGTVIVGWDWQLGPKAVFGVFADFDFLDLSTRHRLFDDFDHSTNHDNAWSVGARLGVLSSPSTLWYITGGYTQVQLEHRQRSSVSTGSPSLVIGLSTVGLSAAGVDTRLAASNWFLRLEYRFTEFDTGTLRIGDDEDFDMRIDTELEAHTARLTLTYKFTPARAGVAPGATVGLPRPRGYGNGHARIACPMP